MKTKTCIITTLFLAGLASSRAQNTWTQKADFGGGERSMAAAFSMGAKGYVGTGHDSGGVLKNDFWEYDPATNAWTQKADFPGPARNWAVGLSIGSKGYIGTGSDFIATNYKDFWEYDPASNTWTQKANFGGVARSGAVGFSIGGKGYLGTGSDAPNSSVRDFWEYDPVTDTWTQKASFGGASRFKAAGFSVAGHGYIGTGINGGCCPFNLLKDVWEYDPASDTWTRKADFGGGIRGHATGFSINETGYIGTGQTDPNTGALTNDLWAFDPVANLWSRKANFGGTARQMALSFSIGVKGYLGLGENQNLALYKDFWEYTPATAQMPDYDAVRDFSIISNPNGVWSYGWLSSLGSPLNLYAVTDTTSVSGISAWLESGTYYFNPPYVAHNDTSDQICIVTFCVPPTYLHLHPGPNNEVTVVRWTAPSSGNFSVQGAVAGLDRQFPTTTTFYEVLNSNKYLFKATIDSYKSPLLFRHVVAVSAGSTLDFAVDFGQDGNYIGDSTGIQFKVTKVQ